MAHLFFGSRASTEVKWLSQIRQAVSAPVMVRFLNSFV
jgi:hypothetical protein